MISIDRDSVPILGLVLAGGHSTRMGIDKSMIVHQGVHMYAFAQKKLRMIGLEVYLSCRADQAVQFQDSQIIPDSVPVKGPISGLVSAFRKKNRCAWLVIPIDMPFLSSEFINNELIGNRNPLRHATVIKIKGQSLLQPLVAIYEPASFPILMKEFNRENYSLTKILKNLNIELVEVDDTVVMANLNFPHDWH